MMSLESLELKQQIFSKGVLAHYRPSLVKDLLICKVNPNADLLPVFQEDVHIELACSHLQYAEAVRATKRRYKAGIGQECASIDVYQFSPTSFIVVHLLQKDFGSSPFCVGSTFRKVRQKLIGKIARCA